MSTTRPCSDQPALRLVIARRYVGLYPPPPATVATDNDVTGIMTVQQPLPSDNFITLLTGSLEEFVLYSRDDYSAWLVDLAHDICDPLHKRGSLFVEGLHGQWRAVQATEPLVASTYDYRLPSGTIVSLTKISRRRGKSRTSTHGMDMRDSVMSRDDSTCWVSRLKHLKDNINSHIFPKRMGDHMARYLFAQFCGATPTSGQTVYDAVFGLCLIPGFDKKFDDYRLGFRHIGQEMYSAHLFEAAEYVNTATFDGGSSTAYGVPPLHGFRFSPHNPGHPNNPPPGLFRWHYAQCVIKRFGDADYQALDNIAYFELPVRMEGDSDDDDDGTDSEADWPSATWDRARLAHEQLEEDTQRRSRVADWISAP